MNTANYVTNEPTQSLDHPSASAERHTSSAADAAAIEQAERREATRKYVERVDRYLARADAPRQVYGPTFD